MIIKKDFYYEPGNSTRMLHIYLPEGYESTEERYPVMYFFDGHNLFSDEDATFGKSWGLQAFLEQWDKPMIIVGMECSHEGNQRLAEYSPYRGQFGMFSEFDPMGDETTQWIVNSVKPYIDRTYRTWWHREATGIAGSSMGGLMALYGVIRYNDWFSKGACISSSIGFCADQLMRDLAESAIHPDTRTFLSWGTREVRSLKHKNEPDTSSETYLKNKAVAEELLKRGAMPRLYCQIGGRHCEEDWEKQIPLFMEYLWK